MSVLNDIIVFLLGNPFQRTVISIMAFKSFDMHALLKEAQETYSKEVLLEQQVEQHMALGDLQYNLQHNLLGLLRTYFLPKMLSTLFQWVREGIPDQLMSLQRYKPKSNVFFPGEVETITRAAAQVGLDVRIHPNAVALSFIFCQNKEGHPTKAWQVFSEHLRNWHFVQINAQLRVKAWIQELKQPEIFKAIHAIVCQARAETLGNLETLINGSIDIPLPSALFPEIPCMADFIQVNMQELEKDNFYLCYKNGVPFVSWPIPS